MSLESARSLRSFQFVVLGCAAASVAAMSLGVPNVYQQTSLASDGYYEAPHLDANILNAWGLAASASSPWWVGDNHSAKATIYDATGTPASLVVDVPTTGSPTGGGITGIAFNPTASFELEVGKPATFVFATEDGTISGWNLNVPPPPPSHQGILMVDNSAAGAVYLGIAIASGPGGDRLYAANFANGSIDVFGSLFQPLFLSGFVDPNVPAGYSPFNIANLGGELYVAYAKVDTSTGEELAGPGLGIVSVFDTNGVLLRSLIHNGRLNAPWGMAIAPSNFGLFSNTLLVGNFGNGLINAYDPNTGAFRGTLRRGNGTFVHVDGLWGLAFGNGGSAGPTNALYYTAGPADENHGVFGRIDSL